MSSDKTAFTTGQIARLCGVNLKKAAKWIDSGELRGYRLPCSKDRRVTIQNFIHFVKTHDLTVDPSKVDESFVSQEIQKLLKLELMKV